MPTYFADDRFTTGVHAEEYNSLIDEMTWLSFIVLSQLIFTSSTSASYVSCVMASLSSGTYSPGCWAFNIVEFDVVFTKVKVKVKVNVKMNWERRKRNGRIGVEGETRSSL